MDTDIDAILYLQLANVLAHNMSKKIITIAEDMSGMPGMCISCEDGGIGFDYRLAMGIPDYWVKTLKGVNDDHWNLHELWHELTTRRPQEKNIGYAESHDQALVGDKTVAFWLMDASMYWHMAENDQNLIIDRGISLHKMIRLITHILAGEGYLNFMGNEFGHPEWIDFPREGNSWSYKYARRQWHLADDPNLKYKYLNLFDKKMIELSKLYSVINSCDLQQLWIDNDKKVLIFQKAGLIFAFNFHPTNSYSDFIFYVNYEGIYSIILNSDAEEFGGHKRIDTNVSYFTTKAANNIWPPHALTMYLPNRTAIVMKLNSNNLQK